MGVLRKTLRLPQANLGIDTNKIVQPELVREFDNTLNNWGHRVVYVRIDPNVHRECWDPVAHQPYGGKACMECYATGYQVQLERHLFRTFMESTPGRLASSFEQTDPGKMYTSLKSGYLKPKVRVQLDDLIIRVEWNRRTEVPMNIINILRIADFDDLREEQGVLVFYKVYCDTIHINRRTFEDQIRKETRIIVVD